MQKFKIRGPESRVFLTFAHSPCLLTRQFAPFLRWNARSLGVIRGAWLENCWEKCWSGGPPTCTSPLAL
jgi:hypothetical protein